MKREYKITFWVLCVVIASGLVFSGCKSADNGNSQTAEFPTVERWWK